MISFNLLPNDTYRGSADETSGGLRRLCSWDNVDEKANQAERQRIFENTARSFDGAAKEIQNRHIADRTKADPAFGAGLQKPSIPSRVFQDSEAQRLRDHAVAVKRN